MMKKPATVALGIALAACGTPGVTAASPDSVTVKQDQILHSQEQIAAEAEAACAKYGKHAQFRFASQEGTYGTKYHTYDCVR